MTQVEQNCWGRWATLKSTVQLIKMKRGAGMDTASDWARATQLLEELKMYADADLMPDEMKEEWVGKIGEKLETLLQ
jgi:hypothetical protein